jgi:hypothetical protein
MYCSLVSNTRTVSRVKVIKKNYPINYNKCNAPFEIIHYNLWGPAPVTTTVGFRWFVTFIDDHLMVCWVYVLKYKKDVLPVF